MAKQRSKREQRDKREAKARAERTRTGKSLRRLERRLEDLTREHRRMAKRVKRLTKQLEHPTPSPGFPPPFPPGFGPGWGPGGPRRGKGEPPWARGGPGGPPWAKGLGPVVSLEVPLETDDPTAPLWATVSARLPEEITAVGDDGRVVRYRYSAVGSTPQAPRYRQVAEPPPAPPERFPG
ncbi:MAG: hypothetical protein WDA60_14005 [Acidimicrobiia bacterium]|jgi:hypothetical protein